MKRHLKSWPYLPMNTQPDNPTFQAYVASGTVPEFAIYRLRFLRLVFVLRGRPERKPTSGRLSSRKPIIFSFLFFSYFFFDGSGQRVIFSLYNYNAKYLKENFTVRRIIFSLRIDKWKQTISFSASNCNTAPYNFALKKKKK